MKKILTVGAFAAIAGASALSGVAYAEEAAAPAPEYTLTGNMTVASDYRFRGLTQTNFRPALQGGFDFAHSSGFYIGNWNSNISWIEDAVGVNAPLEMDFYGGFKHELWGGVTGDVGVLQYYYPGSKAIAGVAETAHTTEMYVALSYGPASLKYSYSVSDTFGFINSDGSYYVDFSVNYPTDFWGITLNGHVGYQKIDGQGSSKFDYTDWKIGLTKDLGNGFSLSAAYIDTNTKDGSYLSKDFKDAGRGTGVVSLTKVF